MKHTFISFKDTETLIKQYNTYLHKSHIHNPIVVNGIAELQDNIEPFLKGEYVLIVFGETWCHRDITTLENQLEINGIVNMSPINSPLYYHMSHRAISDFIFKYFRQLDEDEANVFLSKKFY